MKPFAIYVDSAANIPEEICTERDIRVIPYSFLIDGEVRPCYRPGVPLKETARAFYAALRAGGDAKTSLIPAEQFIQALAPALENGQDVLLFLISSGVSGTYLQAQEAAGQLAKRYPERKVYVLDSANASLGEGLLAIKAADLRDLGESAQTCAEWVRENAYRVNSFLTVDDLKYLRRSGRISKTVAIAGTLLNIKPVLQADGSANAKITACGKARGRKKALAALADLFEKRAEQPENSIVAIAHADCEQDARELEQMLRARGANRIIVEYYDLCTGSHVGPGTVALFFWGTDRRAAQPETQPLPAGKTVLHRT